MANLDISRYTREDLLNVAKASPAAVAAHNKQAWLSLFSSRGIIEDPVGITPFRRVDGSGNDDPLERFYETFIAPNDIVLHIIKDVVAGNEVVRDINIEIKASTGLIVEVPTYALYEIVEEDGNLKVAHLAAYWELRSMVKQVMSRGWSGIKMMNVLGIRMLKFQGLGGVWGYMKGFTGIGQHGKKVVSSFVDSVNSNDAKRLSILFAPGKNVIEYPVAENNMDPYEFLSMAVRSMSVSDLVSAGMVTAFRFKVNGKESTESGIGFFTFDKKTKKIVNARFFK